MTNLTKGYHATPIDPKKGFRIHLLVFALTVPLIWMAWLLTNTTYVWPLWSTPAWAGGVLFHYLGVFYFKRSDHN